MYVCIYVSSFICTIQYYCETIKKLLKKQKTAFKLFMIRRQGSSSTCMRTWRTAPRLEDLTLNFKVMTGLSDNVSEGPRALTCAQEEHLVAPVCGCHLVHCNCSELIVHVGSDHQGALVYWVYSIVHGGVVSHEVDHLVWVILCGFHVGGESASRTLLTKKDSVKPVISFSGKNMFLYQG